MNTRRLSMVLVAPFTLIGGLLVGYETHAIRLINQAGGLWTSFSPNTGFFLVGLLLVLLGFSVRRRLISSYEEEIERQKVKIANLSDSKEALGIQKWEMEHHYETLLSWVKDVVKEGAEERGIVDLGPETKHDDFGVPIPSVKNWMGQEVDQETLDKGSWGELPGQDKEESVNPK